MAKLHGVEVNLGPEMKSTGEVMGVDKAFEPAFYKALISAGLAIKPRGSILISLADEDKADSLQMVRELVQHGYKLFATEGTAAWIQRAGMPVQTGHKTHRARQTRRARCHSRCGSERRDQYARSRRQGIPGRVGDSPGGSGTGDSWRNLDRYRARNGYRHEPGDLRLQRATNERVSPVRPRVLIDRHNSRSRAT